MLRMFAWPIVEECQLGSCAGDVIVTLSVHAGSILICQQAFPAREFASPCCSESMNEAACVVQRPSPRGRAVWPNLLTNEHWASGPEVRAPFVHSALNVEGHCTKSMSKHSTHDSCPTEQVTTK